MKNSLNIGLALLVGFGLGILIMKTVNHQEVVNVSISQNGQEKVKSVFSSGCEIGIMKYCEINKQADCRRFCLLFLEANPDVLNMLLKGLN